MDIKYRAMLQPTARVAFRVLLAIFIISACLALPTKTLAQSQVRIYGTVLDEDEQGLAHCSVVIFIPWPYSHVASAETDTSGFYQAYVEKAPEYGIRVCPEDPLSYLIPQKIVQTEERKEIQQDFILGPSGNLEIYAYENGQLLNFKEFNDEISDGYPEPVTLFYTTDLNRKLNDNNYLLLRFLRPYPSPQPVVGIKLNQYYTINLLWEVENIGRVVVTADNEGHGYLLTRKREQVNLNLNYELAKSHYRAVKDALDSYLSLGYVFSEEIKTELNKGKQLLDQATEQIGVDGGQAATLSDRSLSSTLEAGEKMELERADQQIERVRKKDVSITIIDHAGVPVTNASVSFTQLNHEFLFGFQTGHWEVPLEDIYELMKDAGFSLGLIAMGWNVTEPQKDVLQLNRGREIALAHRLGLRPYGRWIWGEMSDLPWFNDLTFEEATAIVREHTRALVAKYADDIDYWSIEFVGRTSSQFFDATGFTPKEHDQLRQIATGIIRELDPSAKISIELVHPEEPMAFSQAYAINFHQAMDRMLKNRESFDILAFIWGFHGSTILRDRYQTGEVICGDRSASREMFTVAHFYDSYSDYGLPIYLNFVIANSEPTPYQIGYWHRSWDEGLKAEYITNIMRLAFSNPQIVGFGFAPFFFDNKEEGNVSHLIDWSEVSPGKFKFQPKPAFFEIKRLLTEEWRTRGKALTDSDGRVSFRGFAGDYEVTVTLPDGRAVAQNLHVVQDGDNSFTIRLPAGSLPPVILWSLIIVGILLLAGGSVYILRRRS